MIDLLIITREKLLQDIRCLGCMTSDIRTMWARGELPVRLWRKLPHSCGDLLVSCDMLCTMSVLWARGDLNSHSREAIAP